jgi:hypothetical protein
MSPTITIGSAILVKFASFSKEIMHFNKELIRLTHRINASPGQNH